MSVPISPLSDYVVAVLETAESKTKSGFYLPETAKEKPKTSKVVAVGKEVKNVKVGDRIIYGGYTNTEVKVGDTDYQLIKEENIYATIK
jgi:chaperonin GroES